MGTLEIIAIIIIIGVTVPAIFITAVYFCYWRKPKFKPRPKCKLADRCEYYRRENPTCNSKVEQHYCGIYRDVTARGMDWRLRKPYED